MWITDIEAVGCETNRVHTGTRKRMTDMTDNAKLVQMIYQFLAFVRMKDGEGVPISFLDKTSYPGREARTYRVPLRKC